MQKCALAQGGGARELEERELGDTAGDMSAPAACTSPYISLGIALQMIGRRGHGHITPASDTLGLHQRQTLILPSYTGTGTSGVTGDTIVRPEA
jgi:hypothetical protein